MSEKAYENYAWVLLFALGIVGVIFSSTDLLYTMGVWGILADLQEVKSTTGMTLDEISVSLPRIADYIKGQLKFGGLYLLGVAVLVMAIAAVPYRRGERWAWYVSWLFPVLLLGVLATNLSLGGSLWPLLTLFIMMSLLALLFPIRKFFPKQ